MSFSTIIKSFVALGFVVQIDNMFSENFPKEIKEMAGNLTLEISKDQNTFKKIVRRLEKQRVNKLVSTGTMVECTQDCTQTLS